MDEQHMRASWLDTGRCVMTDLLDDFASRVPGSSDGTIDSPIGTSAMTTRATRPTRRFGDVLAAGRRELRLTQDELGVRLGITGRTVHRWETHRRTPGARE